MWKGRWYPAEMFQPFVAEFKVYMTQKINLLATAGISNLFGCLHRICPSRAAFLSLRLLISLALALLISNNNYYETLLFAPSLPAAKLHVDALSAAALRDNPFISSGSALTFNKKAPALFVHLQRDERLHFFSLIAVSDTTRQQLSD